MRWLPGAWAKLLPLHLRDHQLQVLNQRLGASTFGARFAPAPLRSIRTSALPLAPVQATALSGVPLVRVPIVEVLSDPGTFAPH
jgi:hypothetical protein